MKEKNAYNGKMLYEAIEIAKRTGDIGGEVYKDLSTVFATYYDDTYMWKNEDDRYSDAIGAIGAVLAKTQNLAETESERKARIKDDKISKAKKAKSELLKKLKKLDKLIDKNVPYATHWKNNVTILIKKVNDVKLPNVPVLTADDKATLSDIYKRVK